MYDDILKKYGSKLEYRVSEQVMHFKNFSRLFLESLCVKSGDQLVEIHFATNCIDLRDFYNTLV